MCWEHEDIYGQCFDYLTLGTFRNMDFALMLDEQYGVDIIDKDIFTVDLFKFLTEQHNKGNIKPQDQEGS